MQFTKLEIQEAITSVLKDIKSNRSIVLTSGDADQRQRFMARAKASEARLFELNAMLTEMSDDFKPTEIVFK